MSEQRSEHEAQQPTDEMVARRAYEISQSHQAGTPEENWQRAERELREEQAGLSDGPTT